MRKKYLLTALAFLLGLTLIPLSPQAAGPVTLELNGKTLTGLDVPPTIIDGRTYLPYRAILTALGAEVEWDEGSKTAVAVKDGITIKAKIGETYMDVGGQKLTMDVPNRIVDGRTMIPVRYIAQALGSSVQWDAKTRTVKMTLSPEDMFNQFLTGKSGDGTVDYTYATILFQWLKVYQDKLPPFNGVKHSDNSYGRLYTGPYADEKAHKEIFYSPVYQKHSGFSMKQTDFVETGKYHISKVELYEISIKPLEGWIIHYPGGNNKPHYENPKSFAIIYHVWDTTYPPGYGGFPGKAVQYYLPDN